MNYLCIMTSNVYIIGDRTHEIYKIGKANNIKNRLSSLKTANPFIELIAVEKFNSSNSALWAENALHKIFKKQKFKGEWFKLTPNDIQAAILHCRGYAGCITVYEFRTPSVLDNPIYKK